ncbi:alpha/beta hydrolase domain-containing protein [Herbidospora mongoliensis]|uniref:alpha/beta hydrolase domain-containing protein n=1 Tax=Herbidospora mongoliensis TaxID=688067 RepID=UPI003F71C08C
MQHVLAAAYAHLSRWVTTGTPPPTAPPLLFNADGTKARNELGLAEGGIRLSQVTAPTALNTGEKTGQTFCVLFGTHIPFEEAQLKRLYRSKAAYVAGVIKADASNVHKGYLQPADAVQNLKRRLPWISEQPPSRHPPGQRGDCLSRQVPPGVAAPHG